MRNSEGTWWSEKTVWKSEGGDSGNAESSPGILFRSTGHRSSKHMQELTRARATVMDALTACGGGSFLRGWRRALDPNGNLDVDFEDFCRAAAKLKLIVDTELVFIGGEGAPLQLEDVSPEHGRVLAELQHWTKAEFGSTKAMFAALCAAATTGGDGGDGVGDPASGRLAQRDFVAALTALSCPCQPEELLQVYDCCDYMDVGFIQDDDVIFLEEDPRIRKTELFKAKVGSFDRWRTQAAQEYLQFVRQSKEGMSKGRKAAKDRRAPRAWNDRTFESLPAVIACAKRERAREQLSNALKARDAFVTILIKGYGSVVRGFRKELAIEGTYMFSLKRLRSFVNKHNLRIDVSDLWRGLDRDMNGFVNLEELCFEPGLALAGLKRWASTVPGLGTCARIWNSSAVAEAKHLEKSGSWCSDRKMPMSVFFGALRLLGWPQAHEGHTKKLIADSLDMNGSGLLTIDDVEWLDAWRPPEWVYAQPNIEAWREMKALLVKRFGHPLLAWRKALDRDDSNHVTWDEFRHAAERIGFADCASAWRALDQDSSHSISMTEYDPESAELLQSFKTWAEVHFGSIKMCFKALDADGSGSITLSELKRACHKRGWEGDAAVLFGFLDTDGHRFDTRRSITYGELAFLDSWNADPSEQEIAETEIAAQAEERRLRPPPNNARAAAVVARLRAPVEFTLVKHRSSSYLSQVPDWMFQPTTARPPSAAPPRGTPLAAPPSPSLGGGSFGSRSLGSLAPSPAARSGTSVQARGRGGMGGRVRRDASFDDRVDALVDLGRTWG